MEKPEARHAMARFTKTDASSGAFISLIVIMCLFESNRGGTSWQVRMMGRLELSQRERRAVRNPASSGNCWSTSSHKRMVNVAEWRPTCLDCVASSIIVRRFEPERFIDELISNTSKPSSCATAYTALVLPHPMGPCTKNVLNGGGKSTEGGGGAAEADLTGVRFLKKSLAAGTTGNASAAAFQLTNHCFSSVETEVLPHIWEVQVGT